MIVPDYYARLHMPFNATRQEILEKMQKLEIKEPDYTAIQENFSSERDRKLYDVMLERFHSTTDFEVAPIPPTFTKKYVPQPEKLFELPKHATWDQIHESAANILPGIAKQFGSEHELTQMYFEAFDDLRNPETRLQNLLDYYQSQVSTHKYRSLFEKILETKTQVQLQKHLGVGSQFSTYDLLESYNATMRTTLPHRDRKTINTVATDILYNYSQ